MSNDASQYKRKLRGWLSYAFASEVFVIVSLTLFLPICLEQFARDNGKLMPDRIESCSSVHAPDRQCVVKLGWAWIDTASFSLYVISISVALQALTVISVGGIADRSEHRKKLLFGFGCAGAISATLFLALPSSSPIWPLSALLAAVANVGFGVSIVAMNAYLPELGREAPEVKLKYKAVGLRRGSEDTSDGVEEPLLEHEEEQDLGQWKADYDAELSRTTSRISSLGIALGYGAGIVLLILALVPVTLMKGTTFALRLAIGFSGIWWAVFMIPAFIWIPSGTPKDGQQDLSTVKTEIIGAWKRLGGMLHPREIKRLRNTFKYLGAWFLLSDGFTTITSTAVLFGKTTLHMTPSSLIVVGILSPSAGILGSLLWPKLQKRFGWSNLRVLATLVVLASAIPAYGCLGFIPFFQKSSVKFGGLTTKEELYVLAAVFGSVYGAFQGYARAFYAELLPPGEEARWYGLFSITDKSSSFIGPLVVGLISDTTGNIRYAFFFLVAMIWTAVPLLMSVDVEKGREDAREYRYDLR